MTLNDAYAAYSARPGDDTLSVLWRALRLYAAKLRLVGAYPEADREDIIEGAVVAAWRSLDTYSGGSRFSTWFHRIAANHVGTAYRRRMRKGEHHGETIDILRHESRLAFVAPVERPLRDAGSLSLTHRQRQLVEALSRKGDYQATATELGISVKALHSRIDRIKNKVS